MIALSCSASALAACPKTPKEWKANGAKIFVQKASQQHTSINIPDFSKKIGKSAEGKATPFESRKMKLVLVQAEDKSIPLFLSGIMKCDSATNEPVLTNLSWVQGDKSALVHVKPE